MMTNYVIYKTKETDREVTFLVGPRLDTLPQAKENLIKENNLDIEAFLSVTDRMVRTNSSKRNAWFPWIEGKNPSEEVVFGSLMTLRHWVCDLNLKTIYIHCDAGTHRSPTIMGFYLYAFSKEILNTQIIPIEPHDTQVLRKAHGFNSNEIFYSNANDYAEILLEKESCGVHYKKLLSLIHDNWDSSDFLESILDRYNWNYSCLKKEDVSESDKSKGL